MKYDQDSTDPYRNILDPWLNKDPRYPEPPEEPEHVEEEDKPKEMPAHLKPMTWEDLFMGVVYFALLIGTYYMITEVLHIRFGPFH